jgi:uncharacterized protein (DUF1015 family)
MARVQPFRALRPAPAVAARVSSVPYDVVSTEEARALAAGDDLSFLHVTRSEIDLASDTDPHSDPVYALARRNFERLKREAPLETDPDPTLYLYRLRAGGHEQTGVAGCFSIDEYEGDGIRRHERTRRDKEDDRTRHILELRAQTGVVFLTYRARADLDAAVGRVAGGAPLYRFTSADGVEHTLWRADAAGRDLLVDAFARVPALYIADGHHRAASARRARQELRAGGTGHPAAPGAGDPDTFLAVAFPDDQVRILPYHRLVRDLAGRSAAELLRLLSAGFESSAPTPQPAAPGRFSVYLDGRWSTFAFPAADAAASPASRLDCARLQDLVLGPLLGIGDPRSDERIDFVGGIRGTPELERRVDAGRAAVAFALAPVAVADLLAVSDTGETMPPKSTWFEPKLRDGLLVHEI